MRDLLACPFRAQSGGQNRPNETSLSATRLIRGSNLPRGGRRRSGPRPWVHAVSLSAKLSGEGPCPSHGLGRPPQELPTETYTQSCVAVGLTAFLYECTMRKLERQGGQRTMQIGPKRTAFFVDTLNVAALRPPLASLGSTPLHGPGLRMISDGNPRGSSGLGRQQPMTCLSDGCQET